jgi:hypothetical protein
MTTSVVPSVVEGPVHVIASQMNGPLNFGRERRAIED